MWRFKGPSLIYSAPQMPHEKSGTGDAGTPNGGTCGRREDGVTLGMMRLPLHVEIWRSRSVALKNIFPHAKHVGKGDGSAGGGEIGEERSGWKRGPWNGKKGVWKEGRWLGAGGVKGGGEEKGGPTKGPVGRRKGSPGRGARGNRDGDGARVWVFERLVRGMEWDCCTCTPRASILENDTPQTMHW